MSTANGVRPRTQTGPKRTHYVSMHNDVIYPAMSAPAGWEDEHPEDYRPATPEEIARYQSGQHLLKIEQIDLSPAAMDEAPASASPTTLRLMEDDPPVDDIPPPAPAISRPS